MKKLLWVFCAVGLLVSWNLVHGDDFFVIPVKNCCTCNGTLVGTRWCDNGDGTVTDLTTCLVWLKYADWGGAWPWRSNTPDDYDDAHTRAGLLCQGVQISDHLIPAWLNDGSVVGDWRLPTKSELEGITIGDESVSSTSPQAFKYVQEEEYWSSTTGAAYLKQNAFNVRMDNHFWLSSPKRYEYHVWPVRNLK